MSSSQRTPAMTKVSMLVLPFVIFTASCSSTADDPGTSPKSSPALTVQVSKVEAKPAATAKEALRSFLYALSDPDEAAAQAVIKADSSNDVRELVAVVCLFSGESVRFKKALTKQFGDDSWEKFNSEESGGATVTVQSRETCDELLQGDLVESENEATLSGPDLSAPLKAMRVDGGWLIDAEASLLSGGIPAAAMRAQMMSIIKPIRKFTLQVENAPAKWETTLEKLDETMGQEMLQALMGAGAEINFSDVEIKSE